MTIQIDSREQARAIKQIRADFDALGVKHYVSKLYVGDYMSLDNPRVIIDRKQNLLELCSNVSQAHERFRREILRARENGITLHFLCEHGKGVKSLEDVAKWQNPRRIMRVKNPHTGKWESRETKAMTGQTLSKILETIQRKYGCRFLFCDKSETGRRIAEILGVVEDGCSNNQGANLHV